MLSAELFSFLPEQYRGAVTLGVNGGLELATYTIVLTFLLELASLPTVRGVLQQRDGKSLYLSAIALNFLNHYIYGVPIYTFAIVFFCRNGEPETFAELAMRSLYVMSVHSCSYYYVHKTFHTYPDLYKYHRYHHRFNTHVPPISANAVGAIEYLLAYVLPFALAAVLVYPSPTAMRLSVYIITTCNLIIHTPRLEELSTWLPPIFVTPHGHIRHHQKLTVNYAAPWINLDWCVEFIQGLLGGKNECP